jgi:hypothetical protein
MLRPGTSDDQGRLFLVAEDAFAAIGDAQRANDTGAIKDGRNDCSFHARRLGAWTNAQLGNPAQSKTAAIARMDVLAAIEGEHRRIGRDACKRAVDYTSRDALALGVARHGGKKAVEVATHGAARTDVAARSMTKSEANSLAMKDLSCSGGGLYTVMARPDNRLGLV